jgi:DNA helicase II / ATP-dependent DNA helicase PcrA
MRAEQIVNYGMGERVLHPKWGVGIVVSTKGEGTDQEIQIAFPAPLENALFPL